VSDAPVTITWQTNGVAPTSPLMKPLENEIATYEKSHPNVHVQWVQTNLAGNDQEAYLTTNAAGGKVPDVTTENWATVLAGAIPNGILTNLMPFLQRPNPYVKGNKKWLDTWQSTVLPNMEISKSKVELIVGSNVETGIFYNKKLFAEAGITGTPSNWAQWVADMAKLKAKGITPFIFGTGGNCNPSWYERNFESQLLNKSFQKFDPDRSTLQTSSLDVAVGIEKGIISMKNPAYAEGWKLLASLKPYLAPGASTYDGCAASNATTPPLSGDTPLVQGKVAMIYATTNEIPTLDADGFKGKYGLFAFPQISSATTSFSPNVQQKGSVGGPNGPGLLAIPTQKADQSMTPTKLKQVIDLVQYLYAPQNEGQWVNGLAEGSEPPLIKGAQTDNVPGLKTLQPTGTPPPVIQGVTNGTLTPGSGDDSLRLVQAYLGGTMSYAQFARQWDKVLQEGAQQWAAANKVNLTKYK